MRPRGGDHRSNQSRRVRRPPGSAKSSIGARATPIVQSGSCHPRRRRPHRSQRRKGGSRSVPSQKAPYLVIGAGPVGFLVSELLRHRGAEFVVVEPNAERRQRAQARGCTVAPDISSVTGSFKSVIDCAAAPDIVEQLLGLLVPHGTYISVGYGTVPEFDFALVSRKELAIYGIRSGRRSDLEAMLSLVADGIIAAPEH